MKQCLPKYNNKVNGTSLKQVDVFKYCGTFILADGRCIKKVKRRTAQPKATFENLNISHNSSLSIALRAFRSYTEPVML